MWLIWSRVHSLQSATYRKSAWPTQLAEEVPGLDVDLVVADVAVVSLGVDGDGAVGADGAAEQELFQVGSVILVVAEGDAWRPARSFGPAPGCGRPP